MCSGTDLFWCCYRLYVFSSVAKIAPDVQPLQHHDDQAAIAALFRVQPLCRQPSPMPGVFPDYPAPVIRNTDTGTEMT